MWEACSYITVHETECVSVKQIERERVKSNPLIVRVRYNCIVYGISIGSVA